MQPSQQTKNNQHDKKPSNQDGNRLRVYIIAGEHSGDALGGKLMHALNSALGSNVSYLGVGGEQMEKQGLNSLFPMEDVAVMGLSSIVAHFPRILRRVYQTVDAAIAANPDIVVIIDSPDFTHPIAKRIRKRAPNIPIIDFVSPTIWAWRPGRARKMKPYVDHVLALLPFEPQAHEKLGGPACTYIGHPLVERHEWMNNLDPDELTTRLGIKSTDVVLTVLPGSRSSEIKRLMPPFGQTVSIIRNRGRDLKVIIPVIKQRRSLIEGYVKSWPIKPYLIESEDDKFRAFKASRAALAASGTVTLELALSGTPMVVAYKVDQLASHLRFLMKVQSVVLANLVLGENIFPEFLQEKCIPEKMADAIEALITDTPTRERQLQALQKIPMVMAHNDESPSEHAARIVQRYALRSMSLTGSKAADQGERNLS